MWLRATRIVVAGILSGGAILIMATLKDLQWSSRHGLRTNLLWLWTGSRDELLTVIEVAVTMCIVILVLVASRMAYLRMRKSES